MCQVRTLASQQDVPLLDELISSLKQARGYVEAKRVGVPSGDIVSLAASVPGDLDGRQGKGCHRHRGGRRDVHPAHTIITGRGEHLYKGFHIQNVSAYAGRLNRLAAALQGRRLLVSAKLSRRAPRDQAPRRKLHPGEPPADRLTLPINMRTEQSLTEVGNANMAETIEVDQSGCHPSETRNTPNAVRLLAVA